MCKSNIWMDRKGVIRAIANMLDRIMEAVEWDLPAKPRKICEYD